MFGMNIGKMGVIARAIRAMFDPGDLFTTGTNGVWYDPSDMTTLFQDAAGTTPVTAVEQPVGLIRDKSGRNNYAFQSTSANRPTLSARYNLLTKTEQFDDVAWTKTGIKPFGSGSIANTTIVADPNGANTVDFICEDTSAQHSIAQNYATQVTAGTKITCCIAIAKYGFANSRRWAYVSLVLGMNASASERFVVVVDLDPSSGAVTDTKIGASISNQSVFVTSVGNFWVVTLSAQSSTSGLQNYIICGASNSANPAYTIYNDVTYTGDGTSGIYIWGASLVPANQSSLPYQRVNTTTDYDSDATKFPWYLKFNGTSSSLQTASINFTATDKMFVSAGVRKLSDAAPGVLVELSASVASNTGAFSIAMPRTATEASVVTDLRGTLGAYRYYLGVAAPISLVLTNAYDIGSATAAEEIVMRNNGVIQTGTAGGPAGIGNFGSYPLYIGARAGTSLFFNGNLYQLVIAGKQASTEEITSTETYINTKTKAY